MQEVSETIEKHYSDWKKEVSLLNNSETEFQKWLFIHIAGVQFGGKAGELLNLTDGECGLGIKEQLSVIEKLSAKWKFHAHILKHDPSSAKVVIYNYAKVKGVLLRVPPCILFEKLGYPAGVSPEEFLAEIRRRWYIKGEIPHEVGLALGYPIKDVLGYMGLMPLECMGICGWRIYGDPAPSLDRCKKFTQARQCAMIFLAA